MYVLNLQIFLYLLTVAQADNMQQLHKNAYVLIIVIVVLE